MKAEDYISEWCDKTYKGGKELDDWTTKQVMQFANDLTKKNTCKSYTEEEVFKLIKKCYKDSRETCFDFGLECKFRLSNIERWFKFNKK